ncbi:hypothetical protein CSKR_101524 [Clonorchis sinensis]|uniref:Uncharacterized protein n=1 Tax=Clonorchis sinensis TaxID=79923 RepID=A0A3R7CD10_CLOSI|nr:hypothetical protein CSKR_101524 [Clonorchis sinensis]
MEVDWPIQEGVTRSVFETILEGKEPSFFSFVIDMITEHSQPVIIIDSRTPVSNTDASVPYNHDLSGSLIVKNKNKCGQGRDSVLPYLSHSGVPTLPKLIQSIWMEIDDKNAIDND